MDSTTLIAKIRSLGREPKHWIAPGLLAAMLVAPGLWSALTTFNTNASSLPSTGPCPPRRTCKATRRAQVPATATPTSTPKNHP